MEEGEDFMWAVATAAYQIEGGTEDDGRELSMWDVIRRRPGRIADDSPPEMSCEGRRKWKEDVQLIKELGVSHYRFSIDWSRVMSDGRTRNEKGMTYYRDLCKGLVENGIHPLVTLFHADLPLSLYNEGSWLREGMIDDFVHFAQYCFEELGQFVTTWFTINEIQMHAWSGIVKVKGHPFHSLDIDYKSIVGPVPLSSIPLIASKNMIIAHARVYRLYRDKFYSIQHGRIGIILGGHWCEQLNEDCRSATDRAFLSFFSMYLHPLINGDWPLEVKRILKELLPSFTEEEQKVIKGTLDILGINFYRGHLIGQLNGKEGSLSEELFHFKEVEDEWERISGESSWIRLTPQSFSSLLHHLHSLLPHFPLLITENGCADLPEQSIDDHNRIRYMKEHLNVIGRVREEGVNVVGYTAWSLMDNLEWDDGFSVKFGLYQVNEEKKRIEKRSAQFYREYIKEHRKGPE